MADPPSETPFVIPGSVCRDFERASRLEWLETNHTGGFAMGTVAGVNTRRYHALLIAALDPPAGRFSILSRVEETVDAAGRTFALAVSQYPGAVHPLGFELLEEFRVEPFPTWSYRLDSFQGESLQLRKTVCLLDRRQAVLLRYEASQPCRLKIRPLLSFRDYHSVTHRNDACSDFGQCRKGGVSFTPYPGLPALTLFHNGTGFQPDFSWFMNNEYLRELERGLDFQEDLFSPGSLVFELHPGHPAWLLASVDGEHADEQFDDLRIDAILSDEAARRTFRTPLHRALDQFRFTRFDGRPSLIAGYPWFTDWSRDTLISLPALSIAGFSLANIKAVLTMLLDQRSQGLLPNRFIDNQSTPEYNTVDATLWFFISANDFIERAHDHEFLRDVLYPAALDILDWHWRGTFYNIKVDPLDSLLSAGTSGTQLTWMDARVGDYVVTPRAGKPVEIVALWYNALKITSRWAEILALTADFAKFSAQAGTVRASFQEKFWNADLGCLYDVVTPSSKESSIRPNQLFAIALPWPLLDAERSRSVVEVVRRNLLTRVGLRTLASSDPAYRPRFEGDMHARDSAYHQGTVWPWLIGPFISAYLFAFGETAASIEFCRQLLRGMEQELAACCLGSLSEVYDASDPQKPGGCPAQLWSIAQLFIAQDRVNNLSAAQAE
ncbi:MAG TPA: amylo-alpha-1,6-glucosidase [Bryobacteraceae bacterium]|nr:amylo-alpha-1,6-glucosidase [Bryobacteraceae bacterium]